MSQKSDCDDLVDTKMELDELPNEITGFSRNSNLPGSNQCDLSRTESFVSVTNSKIDIISQTKKSLKKYTPMKFPKIRLSKISESVIFKTCISPHFENIYSKLRVLDFFSATAALILLGVSKTRIQSSKTTPGVITTGIITLGLLALAFVWILDVIWVVLKIYGKIGSKYSMFVNYIYSGIVFCELVLIGMVLSVFGKEIVLWSGCGFIFVRALSGLAVVVVMSVKKEFL